MASLDERGRRHERVRVVVPFAVQVHDALRRHDLAQLDPVRIVGAVGAVHHAQRRRHVVHRALAPPEEGEDPQALRLGDGVERIRFRRNPLGQMPHPWAV
jgi:hypothetical protein